MRGAMISRMMRADCTSVSAPPTPLPVSMRIFRSPVAMTSKTPVSAPFAPTPHVLNARYARSSIGSPRRLGVAYATTEKPVRLRAASSLSSSARTSAAVSCPVASTT